MKKRFLSVIITLSIVCLLLPTVTFAKTYGDLEYEVNDDNTVTITDCTSSAAEVEIPAKIDGLPVTTIGEGAFFDCKSLISVTLPDSVTSIGYNAFENCDNLDSVYITDLASYLNIDFDDSYSNPMDYADKLYINNQLAVTIEIPDSVTNIPFNAFDGCDSLISITIPDSVKTIGFRAFSGCTGLTSINIPDSVTSIDSCAFSGCSNLTSVTIGDSVTSISYNAFEDCDSLDSVYITDLASYLNIDFYEIFSNPMYYADKLYINNILATSVAIPDSITTIKDYAFYGCSNITDIIIPDSVTYIGDYAFSGCSNLKSITIPNSVKIIYDNAFSFCSSLKSVTIPDSITSIENGVFWKCSSLTNVTIPNSVGTIYYNAFSSCSSLTSITIPNSVINIYDAAFSHCDNLKNVYFTGTEEEWNDIDIRNFNDCLTNANIHYNTISVILNGNTIAFDVQPQIINDRTMVPVRAIFEALGASVDWNEETRTVTAIKGGTTVKLTINSDTMYINDTVTAIDSPACIIDDRTLVPVRAISEAFNIKAEWDENTRTVILTSV
jgi:hypothetical protein